VRVAYGVMGYGRGHATRTATILPELMRRHDVLILAGGEAYATLAPLYPVVRIPTLGYVYGRGGQRSLWRTLVQNLPAVLDLMWHGPSLAMVMSAIREFGADVIISDAEAWTQRAGLRLGIPRITFDHFGILTHCRPPLSRGDGPAYARDRWAYLALMGQPDRVIVSSFYDAPPRRPGVRVVGPLLRDEVLRTRPAAGEHLLAYFNNGAHQFTPWVEEALRGAGRPVRVYGTQRIGTAGPLEFRPPSTQPFIDDLARCCAVVSTAGNQLVGEAIHFGKPLLVMPEACVEQRCNANAVERLGIGMQVAHRRLSCAVIHTFLGQLERFAAQLGRHARDGRAEALGALETYFAELGRGRATPGLVRKAV
jgi:uncharacterized protein (TIGR00661 family)